MRYLYACFKGYIGFYNGLGLDKVEIDFTKCRNNIVLISGKNASGKSTLMKALNPFPDPSSSFVSNQNAEKILRLFHEGDIYDIKILSPSDAKGGRKVTKAYISKNGMELNTNGNVMSYKDIIFSEFDLDSNYMALSTLSSTDRGLGDKKPAERKKFVSSIIANLEVYNEIYKTLNKKSLIFKSHINTLHTKIQNIGMKNNLEITLTSLRQKHDTLSNQILSLNNMIVELQTRSSINQEEADKLTALKKQSDSVFEQLCSYTSKVKLFNKETKITPEDIQSVYESDLNLIEKYKSIYDQSRLDWISESEKLNGFNRTLNELSANIELYKSDIDYELESNISQVKKTIDELKHELIALNIPVDVNIINYLFTMIDFYDIIIKKIDIFYEGLTSDNLQYIAINFDPNKVNNLRNELSALVQSLATNKARLEILKEKKNKIAVLSIKPEECNIETCPFIHDAILIRDEFKGKNIDKSISDLEFEILCTSEQIEYYNDEINKYTFCENKRRDLDNIISQIQINSNALRSIGDEEFADIDNFLLAISNNSLFNEKRNPRRLIEGMNCLKTLDAQEKLLVNYELAYSAMKDKLLLIEKSNTSIEAIKESIIKSGEIVADSKNKMDSYKDLIDSLNKKINTEKDYIETLNFYNSVLANYNSLLDEVSKIESKSSESASNIIKINEYNDEIIKLKKELEPISMDIQRISGQLTLLDSYYSEYELYKEKYNMLETLKKYCSPTGGGIQTIFMQLYMSKTLELANQVLGMLFGGEFRLLDFVINQNEFRIPFIGSGLPVDDISSGSNSQISIMGMAINLVLLHQASTKFNIACLDELDHALDTRNRFEFVNALFHTTKILNIEQLFVISHSLEADTSSVDIIKLKPYSDYEKEIQMGNVIYDYSEEIKKTLN